MLIYLLRHGLTEYNAQKRYQGQRDIPLSEEGCRELRRADIDPKVVYISTLQRTAQTARVLFPNAKLIPIDGLKEMCFGSFEGRSYVEMEHDPDYLAWVASSVSASARPLQPLWIRPWLRGRRCWLFWRTAAPRWRRWIAMLCRTGITTSGARPMRAALCWTPGTGKHSIFCTL